MYSGPTVSLTHSDLQQSRSNNLIWALSMFLKFTKFILILGPLKLMFSLPREVLSPMILISSSFLDHPIPI